MRISGAASSGALIAATRISPPQFDRVGRSDTSISVRYDYRGGKAKARSSAAIKTTSKIIFKNGIRSGAIALHSLQNETIHVPDPPKSGLGLNKRVTLSRRPTSIFVDIDISVQQNPSPFKQGASAAGRNLGRAIALSRQHAPGVNRPEQR
jgi:hypothetical protein